MGWLSFFSFQVISDSFATPWTVTCQTPLSMDFPGKNSGVGCHFLLQGIFLTKGSNLLLLHCRQIVYCSATRKGHGEVQFSHSVVSDSLRPHESQYTRPPCPSRTPEFTQSIESMMPSSHLILCHPLLLLPSQHQSLFQCVNSLHEVAKVLEFQLQHHSLQSNPRADLLQNGLVRSPCSSRDSQQSSPTPQFKSINSSALSFLHSPTLTSMHDH